LGQLATDGKRISCGHERKRATATRFLAERTPLALQGMRALVFNGETSCYIDLQ
jgi:hypothetical protein